MLGGIQLGLVIWMMEILAILQACVVGVKSRCVLMAVEIWEARRRWCVDMRLLASQAQVISAGKLTVLIFVRIRLIIEQG